MGGRGDGGERLETVVRRGQLCIPLTATALRCSYILLVLTLLLGTIDTR